MRALIAVLGLLVLGCVPPGQDASSPSRSQALEGQVVYHLTASNVAELRSIDVEVAQTIQGGNLVLSMCLRHNPVTNAALGIDHLYYDAPAPPYLLLEVNEPGWAGNFDGMTADGFGSFGSHKCANPAGRGGLSCSAPLVFTLAGDPTAGANTPLELAVHLRFGDGCSGWVSNRARSETPGSDPGCHRLPDCPPPPPLCYPQSP